MPEQPDDEKLVRDFVHDIRNPIGAIVGFADILKNKDDRISEEKRQEVVEALHRTSERLRQIVEEFAAERKRRRGD